jgi:hypothetical protein
VLKSFSKDFRINTTADYEAISRFANENSVRLVCVVTGWFLEPRVGPPPINPLGIGAQPASILLATAFFEREIAEQPAPPAELPEVDVDLDDGSEPPPTEPQAEEQPFDGEIGERDFDDLDPPAEPPAEQGDVKMVPQFTDPSGRPERLARNMDEFMRQGRD